jgi:5-formyltetrahydrofolate cyclo-ligase
MNSQKAALRNRLRAGRRALNPVEHKLKSRKAARAVLRVAQFAAGRRVAIYLPFDHEADTAALIAAARRRGVNLYVPIIADRRHRRLRFCRLAGKTRPGSFGIQVPQGVARTVTPRWLNLVIVPCVGVDAHGRRLGMGYGFYDRAMDFRRRRIYWQAPRMIGLGFDCQRTGTVHAEPWDLRLDALATEAGLHRFPSDQTSMQGQP